MGGRSGAAKSREVVTYVSGLTKETYTEEINGVTVVRTRFKYKRRKKKVEKIKI